MSYRIGVGYKASPDIQTSVAGQEILPQPPSNWTMNYRFFEFSFQNDQECHVLINDDPEPKFLRSEQGFNISYIHAPIWSFKVVESGITFNWFGAY